LEISRRGIKTYSTNVVFSLTRSLSTQANHLGFTKPSNCLLSWCNYLRGAASLHHNENSQ